MPLEPVIGAPSQAAARLADRPLAKHECLFAWKQGRGYAKQALGAIADEARALGLEYIEMTTDPQPLGGWSEEAFGCTGFAAVHERRWHHAQLRGLTEFSLMRPCRRCAGFAGPRREGGL